VSSDGARVYVTGLYLGGVAFIPPSGRARAVGSTDSGTLMLQWNGTAEAPGSIHQWWLAACSRKCPHRGRCGVGVWVSSPTVGDLSGRCSNPSQTATQGLPRTTLGRR